MNPRQVRQYLESLQRAGVSHLPVVSAEAPVHEPQPQAAQAGSASTAAPPRETGPPPGSQPDVSPPGASPAAATPARPVESVDPSQRQSVLDALAQRVAACTKCDELARSRRQTVFGVGDPNARIMFIGEAPGADEDRLGEPFVGKAGQLLNKIIEACDLRREDIYICNILRCRPPGNRNPTPDEAANCREYLDAQIATVCPEYIVCWGSVAAHNLLNVTTSVGRMRGQFHQHGEARVLVTYHPSYLLRNPAAKKQVWADMKFLFADMGVTL